MAPSEHELAQAPRCATPAPARGAAERRHSVEARVRGYERNAAQGNPRPLGAQHEARGEHELAPAPRCATPAPARGAAGRRRDGEAPAWRLGHDTRRERRWAARMIRAAATRPRDIAAASVSARRGPEWTWSGGGG